MSEQRAVERLISYSDAVVAIAATLLVLPLVDIAPEVQARPLGEVLADHRSQLLAFVLSFVVIGRLWAAHHRLFQPLRGHTPALVWLNMLWLLSIVFLPFPTQVVATLDGQHRGAVGLYIGTMLVTSAAGLAMAVLMSRDEALTAPSERTGLGVLHAASAAVALAAALALGVAVPTVGLWALLLLVLQGPLLRLFLRMR
ncbi:TMEM175 family protein [Rhodococcus sp. X156]|uniref:TMEM175 family protein n=1 Tax=Rhodococcus sp. X156 TaxID=2499145 RepID=UPI000FD6CCBD|nr:TMEM175 family protein [Rhodococcus sp. X156]